MKGKAQILYYDTLTYIYLFPFLLYYININYVLVLIPLQCNLYFNSMTLKISVDFPLFINLQYIIMLMFILNIVCYGLTQQLSNKESICNAGNVREAGLIPGSGRSPGERNGNPLQYSCQENPMDRGAQQAVFQSIANSQT